MSSPGSYVSGDEPNGRAGRGRMEYGVRGTQDVAEGGGDGMIESRLHHLEAKVRRARG